MLDTGAEPSLLKVSKKPHSIGVNVREILELTGITESSIRTFGKIELKFKDLILDFHLVPDSFPIKEDGLLGSKVFREFGARIDYESSIFKLNNHEIPLIKKQGVFQIKQESSSQKEIGVVSEAHLGKSDNFVKNTLSVRTKNVVENKASKFGEPAGKNLHSIVVNRRTGKPSVDIYSLAESSPGEAQLNSNSAARIVIQGQLNPRVEEKDLVGTSAEERLDESPGARLRSQSSVKPSAEKINFVDSREVLKKVKQSKCLSSKAANPRNKPGIAREVKADPEGSIDEKSSSKSIQAIEEIKLSDSNLALRENKGQGSLMQSRDREIELRRITVDLAAQGKAEGTLQPCDIEQKLEELKLDNTSAVADESKVLKEIVENNSVKVIESNRERGR